MSKTVFLKGYVDQVWNRKQTDNIEIYIDDAYTIHLDTDDPWEGKSLDHLEFKKRIQFSFKSFPDIQFEITNTIEQRDLVLANWVMTGTNLGPIGEIVPTNNKIKVNGVTIFHFKNEKISGHTQVFDRRTALRQLGF